MAKASAPLSVQFEEAENAGSNPTSNPTMGDIISERLSRRDLMGGMLAVAVVNHEYTNGELMFRGIGNRSGKDQGFANTTREMTEVEMAAHGGSVVEIRREGGKWSVVPSSTYARRITAETPMHISGPAAGHELMRTSADPTGREVRGMVNNCAGGVTPWGTWL